jgi:cytochrome c-type biogenesis protein CcmH
VQNGKNAAEAGLSGSAPTDEGSANAVSIDDDQAVAIRGMVEGLSERLAADGGTLDEWTRLVRSRLVLNEKDKAQAAYDAARVAHPEAANRVELDGLAREAGLKVSE